ncbi:MAG TPA: hypothetical protein VEJ20_03515 [Candidatus Eremiobacteraceae bacterium]|nr:hypothetical protein [Candidatus Eremiobacteraceae bacterium]
MLALSWLPLPARADDGYDLPFVQRVRAATESLRLQLWAEGDGYVRSTDYVPSVGVMYTDHDLFDPPDLAHPTVVIYDEAGRLVACEYQFEQGAKVPAAFDDVPAVAWFDIPRHLHYNIEVDGQMYYAQAEWPTDDPPTADNLRKRGLMPDNGTLIFAFVHPLTHTFIVWAWLPNEDGPFAGENAAMP